MTQTWAVARIFSKRAHHISRELGEMGVGTFQPTYVRRWFVEGKASAKERPLFPGYMLVSLDGGAAPDVDGIYGVLTNNGRHSFVTADEMARLTLDHATGRWNDLESAPAERRKRRRRRPRPGRRVRDAKQLRLVQQQDGWEVV